MRSICFLLALSLAACGEKATTTTEIVVSAAISLKDAFDEIGRLYREQAGVRVHFNFAASGILQKQIEAGAPVDAFASAGERQMDELEAAGLIESAGRRDFARNTLVLVIPSGRGSPSVQFESLADAAINRIAIGNPRTVPAGQYTRQLLDNMGLWARIEERLVPAEDVRQVLDYVARGEVDCGIVYASDVAVARGKVSVSARANDDLHDPILYPIAVVAGSRRKSEASRFIDVVLSAEGQKILAAYGFLSVR